MRAIGAALRVPIQVQASLPDRGDGAKYADARTVLANIKGVRQVRRSASGDTVTDPYVVELHHTAEVQVGDRLTIDGQAARVESSELVRGAFGVPHHREVRAL